MKAVIYTEDLLPITIIDLPPWAIEMLKAHQFIELPVLEKLSSIFHPDSEVKAVKIKRVLIRAERFRKPCNPYRPGEYNEALMLFTKDEESAMKVRAAFLPGQEVFLRDHLFGERRA
jgi:hypothetical protein